MRENHQLLQETYNSTLQGIEVNKQKMDVNIFGSFKFLQVWYALAENVIHTI